MKRTEKITFRVNESEYERIKRFAERYDMALSEYVRRMALIESGTELEQSIDELNFYRNVGSVISKQAYRFMELNKAVIDTTSKLTDSVQGIVSDNMFPEKPRKKRVRDKKKK